MSTPYFHSPTSGHWWSRSKSSPKPAKEKSPEPTTPSRTYSPLQADVLIPDQPPKQSSMFGNFASAIRLRPRKSIHTVAIPEPPKCPSPFIIPPSNSVEPYGPLTSRPYSKAVSAITVTDDDSIEPKTPSDSNLSYQRPLVDPDLFASKTGVAFSSPQDLDQFFVLPDAHVTADSPVSPVSPRIAYRRPHTANPRERLVSESTMPSLRHTATRPIVPVRTQSDVLITRPHARTRKVSMNDIPAFVTGPGSTTTPATYEPSKGNDSGGLRFHTRPRGMTDNTNTRPSLRKDVDRPSLTRQPSFPRSIITPPETSPPSQELPPVPSLKYLSVLPSSDGSPSDPGSSSSSLSFASSASEPEPTSKTVFVEDKRLQNIRDQAKAPSEPRTKSPTQVFREVLSPTLSRRPATADDRLNSPRKMPSQPSLQNKFAGSPSTYSEDQCLGVDNAFGSTRSLKNQRSFHHPRVPVPPLPSLRHANSFTPSDIPVSQPVDSPKDKEKERQGEKLEGTAPLSKRRFLPGSIRRGSVSQAAIFTFDDDTGSLIIPPPELERFDKSPPPRFTNPFGSPGAESMMLPATSTFYDDLTGSPTTGSSFPQSVELQPQDTGPQQILSPAQLLKLEEILENCESEASADPFSHTSLAELGSPKDPSPANSPLFEEFGFRDRSPRKKNSWTDSITSASTVFSNSSPDKIVFSDKVETGSTLPFFDQQQQSWYRPRTASGTPAPLDSSFSLKRSHTSFASSLQLATSMGIESTFGIEPNQPPGGLTPPPRPRAKVTNSPKNAKGPGNRGSIIHLQPLSPPPLRRNLTSTSTSSRSTSSRSSPLSTPKSPPPAFKNDPPMRAIMKKPSFLEIDDDLESDTGSRVRVTISGDIHQRHRSISSIDDSFLDLGRENNSFDTIRTLSMEGPG